MKSSRTYLIILLLLTTAAGFVFAYREYLEISSLRYRLDDPNAGLEKRYEDALKLIKDLRAQLAAANARLVASASRARSGNGEDGGRFGGGQRGDFRGRAEAMRALFNSPQFQALRALDDKGRLDQRYALLFRLLSENGVSAQQIDQLKNLLVQRQQATMDAMQAARQNGINPRTDPADFQQAIASATSDVDNQIKSDLGDSAYAQYQQYQQTLPEQTVVSQLQQTLSYTGSPLTDTEAQQLVQVLQQNASGGPNGSGGDAVVVGGRAAAFLGGGGVTITPQAITQAASVLAPAQVQALQQIQEQQQAQQQMRALMRSTFQSQQQAAPAPGG